MKPLIIVLFLLFTPVLTAQVPDSVKIKSLNPVEFQSALQNDTNALLIDVREFFEYRKSRIKNAVNIPSSVDLQTAADTIDKERDLFFYCTSGFRSKRVARSFIDYGFRNLFNLNGGITAWKKADMQVEKKRLPKRK